MLLVGFELDDLPFEKKLKGRRYILLLPKGYELVTWDEFPAKTLYDYDVLLLNFTTLNRNLIPRAVIKEEQIRAQLNADEGGFVVVFSCRKQRYVKELDYHTLRLDSYDILPKGDSIETVWEYSEEFRLEKPGIFKLIFEKYYKGQDFYFSKIPKGSTIFARNRKGGVLAFMYRYGKGKIVVLPEVSSKREVLEFLIERVIPEFLGVEEPEWINEIPFLDEEMLLRQRSEIDRKLSEYRHWKRLLYGIGPQLQEIVFEALQKMGLKVWEPEEKGMHDFEMELKEDVIGVIEVTGSKKRIGHEPLTNLLSYTVSAKDKYPDKLIKGVLIENPEHHKPLDDRDDVGFTDAAIEIAEKNDFCLIKTLDLYKLLQQYLSKELNANDLKRMIFEAKGLLQLD